jgi:hypothetical protein
LCVTLIGNEVCEKISAYMQHVVTADGMFSGLVLMQHYDEQNLAANQSNDGHAGNSFC